MIDNFVLALTHGLMLLAAWRLLSRRDLDDDTMPPESASGPAGLWAKLGAGRKGGRDRA
jgi:hypothetical protein